MKKLASMRVRLVCASWGQYTFLCQVFRQSAVSRNVSQGYAKFQNPFDSTIQPLAMQVKGQTRLSLLLSIHFQVFLVFAFAFILEPRPSPLPRFPLHPASLDCCCGCEGALLARARSPRAVDFRFVPYVAAMPMDSCTVGAEASSASWWACFAYHAAEACKVSGPVH